MGKLDGGIGRPEPSRPRKLDWPALRNARDLGGLPAGGSATRFGVLVRADSLSLLTAEGQAALRDYGIRRVIDLRAPRELAERASPLVSHAAFQHHPVIGDEGAGPLSGPLSGIEAIYRWIVDQRGRQLAAVLESVASAPDGGVLVYCHAGKDRTGIVVAILLELAGVERAAVVEDHEISDVELQAVYDQMAEEQADLSLRTRFRNPPGLLARLLDHLDSRYGGVSAYLSSFGVGVATQERLRGMLLTR